MPSTRIFVGGLSDKVDRQDLGEKLSRFADVQSIDLKEKTDPEGNVLLRFAYVNLEASPSQLEQCIQQLHGASWKGSHLRVEQAKENFLDRLKKERAAKKQEENTFYEKSNGSVVNSQRLNGVDTGGGLTHYKGHTVYTEQTSEVNDINYSKIRKECRTNEENRFTPRSNQILPASEQNSQKDSYSISSRKEKKKKNDEVEEEILSSFKQFSSVWADSDNENDEEAGAGGGYEESRAEQPADNTADDQDQPAGDTDLENTRCYLLKSDYEADSENIIEVRLQKGRAAWSHKVFDLSAPRLPKHYSCPLALKKEKVRDLQYLLDLMPVNKQTYNNIIDTHTVGLTEDVPPDEDPDDLDELLEYE
ncbi:Nucleolar protein 8 [Chionoecetes opilio]|uniref:Nucleolar protein 8 n=1 Tax=Chionoecetes opilio TaxID=41210 RepID=A0A8J8WC03_CHIOP|nr:Nucleolar protein 8 [Chionoecetes opilio]